MDARFYNSDTIDIERLASDIVNIYVSQGYQAQQIGSKDQVLVQLKKGGDFEAILGMQAALSLTLQHTAGGTLAMIGQQKWIDKAAVGAVGIVAFPVLWPLALTAGVGTLRQASLGNQVLNMVDGLVHQQAPGIVAGPVPVQIMPQIQQQYAPKPSNATPVYVPPQPVPPPPAAPAAMPTPPPAPAKQTLRCPNCNTPYEQGDTFCSGCGRSLTQKEYCPSCHTEIKPGVSFCPNCGASTFQSSTQKAQPAASSTPTYTPPTPTPAQPARPATPVYTPPSPPAAPPSPPTIEPYAAPTIAAQPAPAQPKPPEPYYVPSQPQQPPVAPQPKVTLVPQEPKPAAPTTPPKRPEKQYYIPSNQAQSAQPAQQPQQAQTQKPNQQPAPPKPLASRPSSQPSYDPNAVWGTLTFEDGSQIQLKGEQAVVGRYDHDLGGEPPQVELNQKQGADTVSRVHASLAHIGSSYTVTDLNSTNATRVNGKRLEPDKATPINDGDKIQFGKVVCTFQKA